MEAVDLSNLKACNWSSTGGGESVADIERLEGRIGTSLPSDFRQFLREQGAGYLDAWARCTFPTPFGEHGITSFYSVAEIEGLLDSAIVPRNMICIGSGDFSAYTCLSVCSIDRGSVYSLDGEMNFFKELNGPQQFYGNSPQAKEFYRMRDADELPQRAWGYDNCYHVTDSFSEFLSVLRPEGDENQNEGEQVAAQNP